RNRIAESSFDAASGCKILVEATDDFVSSGRLEELLLSRLSDLECKQCHYECYDYENSLSLRLPSVVIVHEIANVKDCGSQVWNRNSELVNPHEGRSRIRAFIRSWRVRVAVCYEGVLTRIYRI